MPVLAQTGDMFNRFRLAQSYEQAGEFEKAKNIYEDLLKAEPDNFQFFDALNKIYVQQKEFDNSIIIIERRLKSNPQDINLKGLLGATYYQKGDEAKAFSIWDEALESAPQNIVNYRIIANYAIEERVFNKAIEYLSRGKKINDENFAISYELANLYSLFMKYTEAAEEYCSVLQKMPKQLNMIQGRISQYINKPEAMEPTIQVVGKYAKENENINFYSLLAWLYMENDQFDKAFDVYLTIDSKSNSAGMELYNFAVRAFREKHFDEASESYKKIIDSYPSSPFFFNAKIGYAKTLEATLDQKNNNERNSWKPFYNTIYINKQDYNEVLDAYSDLIQKNRGTEIEAEASYRIGLINKEKFENYDEAVKYFEKVTKDFAMSKFAVLAYNALAEIKIFQNDLKSAADLYTKVPSVPRCPEEDKIHSWLMKAKIEFWNGAFQNSLKLLKNVTRNLSDNDANDAIELGMIINTTKNDSLNLVEFAKAELLLYQKKFAPALDIYTKLSANENLLSVKDKALIRIAEVKIAVDNLPEAIVYLNQIGELKEKNIYSDWALFLLGKLYQFGISDLTKARESYEKLLANFPNSLYLDTARENITKLKENTKNTL